MAAAGYEYPSARLKTRNSSMSFVSAAGVNRVMPAPEAPTHVVGWLQRVGRPMWSRIAVAQDIPMLARGARAVVASLLPVSDEIGAALMTEFY